ncbi:ABC transporter transmembrane domain-containing protein [Agarivorans sp. 1_MG-2023]|uniref:ABC transporter transmembrane domain-containing protein n=1 Tax=Agarivorans sp. 1_MG-2023 TaxID=3062634 RepID=UPI0026E399B3|nr:ABC transporter transmembrane domain-containing protein [Agarivorans sp. 1_MG-2023]MDO6765138.1 ABC transporter transmembrane domain-containing protein [Agarivorans sp. 1_MG-2023]
MRYALSLLFRNRSAIDVLLSSMFINLLSLALPFAMLQIYDRILPNQGYGTATVLMLGVAVAILLELVLRYVRSWLLASAAANFELHTTIDAVKALLASRFEPVTKLGRGGIFNGLNSIAGMRDLYSGQAALALIDFPFVIIFLALVAYIGGALVFIPIVVWGLISLLVVLLGKQLSHATQELALSEAERSRLLINVLSGLTTTKALALENGISSDYREVNFKRLQQQQQVDWLSAKLQELIQGASQGTTLVLVLLGCLMVLDGQLTTGGLAACSILAGRAVAPLSAIISLRSRMVTAKSAMHQVSQLTALKGENFSAERCYQQKLPLGPVTFNQLSAQTAVATLCQANFSLPAGCLAVVQSNPLSHASLVLSMLAGFHQPKQGSINIADVELSQHDANEYRQSVIYLAPWPTLFAGSLIENMTLFRPELEAQAMVLAEELGLSTAIALLPAGYQTRVGDSGNQMLNKGAIKLIALVRALAQQPSILLLDEPMLSLDVDAQQRLLALLNKLKGEMTVIVASHFDEIKAYSDIQLRIAEDGLVSLLNQTKEA